MWCLGKTAAFAIFLTFFSVQINARYKMYNDAEQVLVCRKMAETLAIQDSNKKDAEFFKKCIVDYFGFSLIRNTKMSVPEIDPKNFYDSKTRPYMKLIAKRVERFFIRNGNWYNILKKKKIFKANDCRDLLYIVTATYIYALYVLHTLKYDFTACESSKSSKYQFTYSLKSRGNVCYIKPLYLTCAEEIEFNLLGRNSGSLTARFNQFFKEPIGEDRSVPGFNKDSDMLMGVRITAFSLENIFPQMFRGSTFSQNLMLQGIVGKMISSPKMKLLSVAVAIFRMKSFSGKYFNELLSDQSPLRAQISLARVFQHWSVELTSFDSKIKAFMQSPHYNYELNYRRRHKIAFQLVIGRLESKDEIPSSYVRLLAQYAICLIYNTPVYLTSGAVRHSVIKQKLTPNQQKYFVQLEDYWHSMLENWAIATRVYKEECLENNYKITACLLRMSKSLYLMFDAMVQMRLQFIKSRRRMSERLMEFKETLVIANHWVLKYRNKGYTKLPIFTPSARKRPVGMTSKRPFSLIQQDVPFDQTDDFPEWSEPEQRIENEKAATETVVKPLGEDNKSSDDTKSLTKDAKGAHKNEPLIRDSEVTKKEEQLVEKNEDADVQHADDQRKKKLLDKDVGESVGSQMKVQTEKNVGKSPDIYLTSPLTPDVFDLADTEEIDNFATPVSPVKRKFSEEDMRRSPDKDEEFPIRQTLPDEEMARSLNEDEESPVRRILPDENMARSLDEDEESPVMRTLPDEEMVRSLGEDEKSPVWQTLPDKDMARSLSEDEESPVRRTLPDEDMARSLDEDEESPVRRTLPEEEMAMSLSEDEESPVRQTLPDEEMARSLDEDEESPVRQTLPDEEMARSLSEDEESPVWRTLPDEEMARSLSEDEESPVRQTLPDEEMARSLSEDEESPVRRTLPDEEMARSLSEDEESPVRRTLPIGSSMVEPSHKTNMKNDTASMVEPHSKVTAGSSMTNPMDDDEQMRSSMDEGKGESIGSQMNTEKSVDSSMAKPENQNIKETADSPIRQTMNEDSDDSMGSPMAKPPDNDNKEPLSPEMKTPLDNHTEETADLLMRKPLKNDIKESAGVEWTKPLDKVTEKTSDSPMVKPLGKDTEKTSSLRLVKPLDNDNKMSGTPMPKPLDEDTKKTSNSPMPKPLENDFKETAGVETEEPTHDDFTEYPTSDAHDVPKKTTQTKSGGNKTHGHPRFFSSYHRRRRYGYTVSRRRRSIYASRRRRSIYASRRRRSIYASRRRRSIYVSRRRRSIHASRRRRIIVKPKASRFRMGPDETKNIQKFLRKFNCHFQPEIERMILYEGCMDKIQRRVRRFNRVAFSHFAQVYGKSFRGKMWWKETKDNVLVKTEL